jgi:hypothetical protein
MSTSSHFSSVHDASSFGMLFKDLSPTKKTKSIRRIMESAPVYRLGEIARVMSESLGTTSMRYGDLSDDEDDEVVESSEQKEEEKSVEVPLPLRMLREFLYWDKRDTVLYSCAVVFIVFVITSTSSTYGWLPLTVLLICFLGTSSHGVRSIRALMCGSKIDHHKINILDNSKKDELNNRKINLHTPLKTMDQGDITTWLRQDLGLEGVADKLENLGKKMKCDIDGALLTEVEEEKDLDDLVGRDTPRLVRKKLMTALRDVRIGRRNIFSRKRVVRHEDTNVSEKLKFEERVEEEVEEKVEVKEIVELKIKKNDNEKIRTPLKSPSIPLQTPHVSVPISSSAPSTTSSSAATSSTSSNKTSNQQDEKIAIVGYSCILPGGQNVSESWDVIRNKLDCIKEIPEDRVDVTAYYHPEKRTKDKIYCKRGGFIPDFEFDALEYNLNMLQLEDTDMNQILSLVKVKEALQDADLDTKDKRKNAKIGCVLGIGGGQKASHEFFSRLNYVVVDKVLRKMGLNDKDVEAAVKKYKAHFPEWRIDSFPGFLGNVTAGRITNVFDLDGMNCVVDAACASSLVALKVAIDEILHGDCDTMIAGATCT